MVIVVRWREGSIYLRLRIFSSSFFFFLVDCTLLHFVALAVLLSCSLFTFTFPVPHLLFFLREGGEGKCLFTYKLLFWFFFFLFYYIIGVL